MLTLATFLVASTAPSTSLRWKQMVGPASIQPTKLVLSTVLDIVTASEFETIFRSPSHYFTFYSMSANANAFSRCPHDIKFISGVVCQISRLFQYFCGSVVVHLRIFQLVTRLKFRVTSLSF